MRFMIIVKATHDSEAGVMPEEKLIAEMAKYHEELVKAGALRLIAAASPLLAAAGCYWGRISNLTLVWEPPILLRALSSPRPLGPLISMAVCSICQGQRLDRSSAQR
jgi:hypothetical protein